MDTHAEVHVAAAVDHLGGSLGAASFPTTAAGYRDLLSWLRRYGTIDRIGVEGTGSYGAALARYLRWEQITVVEVSCPNRQARRRHGKSDVVDAIAAARAVLAGDAAAPPKSRDGAVEALRAVKLVQRSATKARTVALNQLHSLLVTAEDGLRAKLRGASRVETIAICAAFRVRSDDDSVAAMTRLALRELALRVRHLDEQLDRCAQRIARITAQLAPKLLDLKGIGPDVASTLLITAGDNPDRMHHEKSFASLCGTSPLQASSGKTTRHCLNRGGDRQANAALWRVAIVRMGTDQRTRDYVARRIAEGKNKPEIIRCLKRYIAREVFNTLTGTACRT
ncbi:IS110 family transposase [Amycolatopsis pithecellobii]|uniref:IS110 family transposase n=1 Tax=Amycolatopsis pithecellobii TaxID=664692 RepID=UPI0028ABB6D1|nr:IS110 family transposase [Amycolatopsis pithecellobii]